MVAVPESRSTALQVLLANLQINFKLTFMILIFFVASKCIFADGQAVERVLLC